MAKRRRITKALSGNSLRSFLVKRENNRGEEAAFGGVLEVEALAVAVELLEAEAGVGGADAFALFLGAQAAAVVFDEED